MIVCATSLHQPTVLCVFENTGAACEVSISMFCTPLPLFTRTITQSIATATAPTAAVSLTTAPTTAVYLFHRGSKEFSVVQFLVHGVEQLQHLCLHPHHSFRSNHLLMRSSQEARETERGGAGRIYVPENMTAAIVAKLGVPRPMGGIVTSGPVGTAKK